MMQKKLLLHTVLCLLLATAMGQNGKDTLKRTSAYRPVFHFTPRHGWMNDPNGMVYHNGLYHLFFQYNPDSTVWGPMHWGHAVSQDLVHWRHLPIALYPDSLGTIFSGSAVIDTHNTAGFGANAMVAVYTQHNAAMEKEGSDKFQNQSIAYSLDGGKSWTKYKGNPVLKNPGIRDFRDPKVAWYAPLNKWIMTLATLDHITFYSSADLKHWTKESTFGKTAGAHGGVWECPDLFPLTYKGQQIWVLIVNINPGGPNGGSATQYFTGHFDGHTFTADHTHTKWLDYGPDEYAGVTWNGTGKQRIFIGWMSNWTYAQQVPTKKWRSATTVPRVLGLDKVAGDFLVRSQPVAALSKLAGKTKQWSNLAVKPAQPLMIPLAAAEKANKNKGAFQLSLDGLQVADFTIELTSKHGDSVLIGYNRRLNKYFIDRTHSGLTDFNQDFAAKHTAPRFSMDKTIQLKLLVDKASVELFADRGLTTMTSILFPRAPLSKIRILSGGKTLAIKKLEIKSMR